MKRLISCTALLLAFLMLFTACGEEKGEEQTATETAEETAEETATATFQGMTDADYAYLKTYLADYEAGKIDGKKLFDYERFEEFIKPFAYKGLTYPDDDMIRGEVTDEEVDNYLTMILMMTQVPDDQYQTLTEGVVQKFDVVTIDFRGLVDGQESDNTTGTDQELAIGSGAFMEGFESGLIGKNAGEEIRLDLKFSPYYGAEEVAGKDVTFFVTVKQIRRPALPELTVDLINTYYSTEFKTVEEMKTWFKEALTAQKANNAYSVLSSYLQKKIMSSLEVVQYPEVEMEHFSSLYLGQYESAKGDADWEAYCSEKLGMTYEELQKDAESYAKEQVEPLLMMYFIEKEEGLSCTTEQLSTFIEGYYNSQNSNGYYSTLEEMIKECTAFYGLDFFEQQVIGAMASEKIVEYAVKEAV